MNNLQSELDSLASLDRSVLEQLHDDMGEDVQEVLNAFLESIDELLAELKSRSADDTTETNSRRAHSIKSSAATIGMTKLSAIAASLEKSLRQDMLVDIDDLAAQLEREFVHSRHLLGS